MAQRTAATFKATKNSRFSDNTSGLVTAGNSRDMYEDVADSFLNISDHLLDEDDMASDSATKVPSQQSVKAYVDAQVAGALFESNTSISSAEILNCFTSPIELIPAPGAGMFIQVLYGYTYVTYGGTAYSNEPTQIQYGNGRTISGTYTTFISNTFDTMHVMSSPSVATNGMAISTEFVNQNIEFAATTADPITGNGTIVIKLVYRIVTL